MPITGRILDVAVAHPNQVCIADSKESITYAQLVADSRATYAGVTVLLSQLSTAPTPASETCGAPIVAVSLESAFHSARLIAGLAGYPVVSATIDPHWPLDHQVGVIVRTGIGVVISDSAPLAEALAHQSWAGTVITAADFADLARSVSPAPLPAHRPGDEPFLLLFSSGTTGNPKAFIKTRHQYRENFAVSSAYLEPLPGVHTLAPGPVSYSLTLYAIIESLASGGTIHLANTAGVTGMGGQVASAPITRIVAVPAVVQALIAAATRNPTAFDALELVVTGGANLPAAIRGGLAHVLPEVRLISYYGAAEIGFIGDSRDGDGTVLSLYTGIEAEVRDTSGAPVSPGELGTLWIKARACSDGYVAGTADVELRGPGGWATVGDQARIATPAGRAHAQISLAGRAGDIVVTGGHKVALPEVDRAYDGVDTVCAVALPSESLGSLIALVVEGGSQSKAELRATAQKALAPQFVPQQFYRVASLPRTVGGKIKRQDAAQLIASGKAQRL